MIPETPIQRYIGDIGRKVVVQSYRSKLPLAFVSSGGKQKFPNGWFLGPWNRGWFAHGFSAGLSFENFGGEGELPSWAVRRARPLLSGLSGTRRDERHPLFSRPPTVLSV